MEALQSLVRETTTEENSKNSEEPERKRHHTKQTPCNKTRAARNMKTKH
ncbi:unnamed protein product [Brassica oleracea]